MAEPAIAGDEQRLKQRAMRRLALALVLIVAAIVGLGLLDHYSSRKRPIEALTPSSEPPPIATLPPPKPLEPGSPTAQQPALQNALPPPPPPAVDERPTAASAAQSPTSSQNPDAIAGRAPARGPTAPPVEPGKSHAPGSAAAPGPATAPTVEARQGFVVQLGMFTTVENAQSLQAKLKEQGIPAFLETRVVVGPLRDRAEADAVQHKLKALGVGGVIVQRK